MGDVGHDAGISRPDMKLVARRLHREGAVGAGTQIEHDLVRGAGGGRGQCSIPADLDRAMEMTAEDALDLGMPLDQPAHRVGSRKSDQIHVVDVGAERRVVHEENRGPLGRRRQCRREPCDPFCAEFATGLARHHRIEPDQAHGMVLDHVVQKIAGLPKILLVGKDRAQARSVIVIAGHEIDRHRQSRQELAQYFVFLDHPAVDEIAGREDHVRSRLERVHMLDRLAQHVVGGHPAIGEDALRSDMEVAELGDDHG
jgi:hypothetical protein